MLHGNSVLPFSLLFSACKYNWLGNVCCRRLPGSSHRTEDTSGSLAKCLSQHSWTSGKAQGISQWSSAAQVPPDSLALAGTAQGPTKATGASRIVDPNVAALGKSHLILKRAHRYPQTLKPFFVRACLPPFPQKIHLIPFSKIVQSYYHIHSKKIRDFSGKPDEKNPHSTSSPFSQWAKMR